MQNLTVKNAQGLIGKTIKWFAPAAKENQDYTGTAKIMAVDFNYRRLISSENLDGDNLDFAFVDDLMNDGSISYSDSYRNVTFKIIE